LREREVHAPEKVDLWIVVANGISFCLSLSCSLVITREQERLGSLSLEKLL
jgi:hypothetical protein